MGRVAGRVAWVVEESKGVGWLAVEVYGSGKVWYVVGLRMAGLVGRTVEVDDRMVGW